MADYCLIGKRLNYSFSKTVHNELGYDFDLVELKEEELASFVKSRKYKGYNVTIPFKSAVIEYLSELSPEAKELGVVNLVMDEGTGLKGYNMDIRGMEFAFKRSGADIKGKKVLILGTGNTSKTAEYLAREMGAREIVKISRSGENSYDNLFFHQDAEFIINTTPVGTFPGNEDSLVDLSLFPRLVGVQEVIYNPLKSRLVLQAEERGLKVATGLDMLVGQAAFTSEKFRGELLPFDKVAALSDKIRRRQSNIVLIGMPSSGKTTVGRAVSKLLGAPFIDTDEEIEKQKGMTVPEIFAREGEPSFRAAEAAVIAEVSKLHGAVIATGGGAVLKERNRLNLKQNGVVFYLKRDLSSLSSEGRPLSAGGRIEALYRERAPIYEAFRDLAVTNDRSVEIAASEIAKAFQEK